MTQPRQLVLGALSITVAADADADALFAQLAQLSHATGALYAIAARSGPPVALPDARLIELLAAYDGIRLLLDLADFVEQAGVERDDDAPCAEAEVSIVH